MITPEVLPHLEKRKEYKSSAMCLPSEISVDKLSSEISKDKLSAEISANKLCVETSIDKLSSEISAGNLSSKISADKLFSEILVDLMSFVCLPHFRYVMMMWHVSSLFSRQRKTSPLRYRLLLGTTNTRPKSPAAKDHKATVSFIWWTEPLVCRSPLRSTLKFNMVFVEVPKNHIGGFHNLISKALSDGTTVVIHGTETDATSYGSQLRDACAVESLHVLSLAVYNTGMFTLHYSMHVTTMLILAPSLPRVWLHTM